MARVLNMRWFRPVIVVLLILTAVAGFFTDRFESEFMSGLITGMAVWWFKSRDEAKRGNT